MEITTVGGAIAAAVLFLVICALACWFIQYWMDIWLTRVIRQWITVVNCTWRTTLWACLNGAISTLVETVLLIQITILCVQIVWINLQVLIAFP